MSYVPLIKSFFSGAGGFDYGLNSSGCEVIESLEYDPICCDTLRRNFNHSVVQQDIRNVTVLDQLNCDVMAFTYPCTKYSTIADIHGTRTGDELFLHAFRHVALFRPECFVLENVPGMKKFKVVMECFTKIPDYYVTVFCPVNASNWLPQNRARLIVIATRKPFSIQAPSSKRSIRLKDIIDQSAIVELPEYAKRRLQGKYRDLPIISDPSNDDIAPTCVAHYAKDVSTRMVRVGKNIRPYTVREYARLQGFPDTFEFSGTNSDAYRQIGNAVAIHVGEWVGTQIKNYFNGNKTF